MDVGLSPRDFVLDGDILSPPQKGAEPPPIFGPCLLWPNGWMHQDATWYAWYGGRPHPRDFVLDGDPAPLPKKGRIFGPCPLWPNGWMDQDGTWHRGRRWSRPHCARWGPSPPPQKRGQSPQFSAHLYCGQTAGCIKMQLGMEVGLNPSDFVSAGDPVPCSKRGRAPQFSAHVYRP